jgi:hypothetical protein
VLTELHYGSQARHWRPSACVFARVIGQTRNWLRVLAPARTSSASR